MAKILYLITKSNWGGAQRYVYDLATNTPRTLQPVVAAGGDGLLKQYLSEKNISNIDLPAERNINILGDFKLLVQLFRIVSREKPDVLHVNSSKLAGFGAFVGWCLRVPTIIFTAHGWPFNEDRNLLARGAIYFFSWLTALFSDITITITEKDFIQGTHTPFVKKKMRLLPLAINTVDFMPRELARHALTKIDSSLPENSEQELWLGNIAELHKNKGLEYGLQALAKLPPSIPWRYVHMGEGEEKEKIVALAQKLGIANRVHFVGFVAHASSHLKAFDVFLFPSIKEGLSYTLLEASQAALPVVATDVGGNPDILGQNAKLVPSKNVKALTQAITELLENEAERKELGKKLKERVAREFNFEKFLASTYELYNSM